MNETVSGLIQMARLHGATVLVTGGTGCIGSALMAQVADRHPARLVSVSR